MDFTGSQLTFKRPFFTQTGNFGFTMACVVDNTTGQYRFGVSGVVGVLEFKLDSGRLYYQDQFIHVYKADETFLLEGRFNSGSASVLRDNSPLVYGLPKSTGSFDTFYATRANAAMGGTFAVNISGDNTPFYAISQYGYLLSSGQAGVTGYFANQDRWPIRVFNSTIQASQNYTFGALRGVVAAGATGRFAYSGDFSTLDLTQPILTTFNTSFNDVSVLFTIIDARTLNRFVQLTGPGDFTFDSSSGLSRDITRVNYSGGFLTDGFNANLALELSYQAGTEAFTGAWNIQTGLSAANLTQLTPSTGRYFGSGTLPPNSYLSFLVSYSGQSGNSSRLVISGAEVINPINQILSYA